MLAYVTVDPGDYKPFRVPQADEHVSRLTAFLTPGEYEAVWFGIYAMKDLEGVSVAVPDETLKVDVRYMHFWPQRTRWHNREYYITPELLLPCIEGNKQVPLTRGILEERPFNLQQHETGAFWLTLHASADARPGVYNTSVVVSSSGSQNSLEIPLEVEVLPFQLPAPADRYWLLYCDPHRWVSMSPEQVFTDFQNIERHGITGFVEMPFVQVKLSGEGLSNILVDAARFREMVNLCRKAGIPGPHVLPLGDVPKTVRDAIGLKANLSKGQWPDELRAGVVAVARAVVEETKDIPAEWYFYGVDEATGKNTYAIQEYECWRQGGAKTYATIPHPESLDESAEYLTAACLMTPRVCTNWKARTTRERCAEAGTEFWWYGTGTYVNPAPQEGGMLPNRYGTGCFFWKTGARAAVSWTFCRPQGDVFNDFDGSGEFEEGGPKDPAIVYPHLLKPDDWSTYQGPIPTIAWESLREGVDDFKYLYKLKKLIDVANGSTDESIRSLAAEADESLIALVESIPWSDPVRISEEPKQGLNVRRLHHVRRKAADMIVDILLATRESRQK
jgi:hypothetical protein